MPCAAAILHQAVHQRFGLISVKISVLTIISVTLRIGKKLANSKQLITFIFSYGKHQDLLHDPCQVSRHMEISEKPMEILKLSQVLSSWSRMSKRSAAGRIAAAEDIWKRPIRYCPKGWENSGLKNCRKQMPT